MSVVGGEMATPDRIKYIQGQMRIAIQNHQVLWQRLIYKPQDSDVENMLKMLQNIIMSLGRRQTELMYQYKHDLRLKYPGDEDMQKKISLEQLGWPDRNDPVRKHMHNGSSSDTGRKPTAQLVRKNLNAQLVRPGQKMTSLLKPSVGNANQQLQRKESERLKAAAAKQAESAAPVITRKLGPGLKPKIVLKVQDLARRMSNEKFSDSDSFPEVKESELAGYKITPQDNATDLAELSQDQYLEFFGLVHKEKSKSMVVNQKKRKRRTAAGQSDFYKDFFQPKRPYNRKTLMTGTESPISSQELTEVDSTEFSPPSEKPSVPPSPDSSCSTELFEESTPQESSPVVPDASENIGEAGNHSEEVAAPKEPGDAPAESSAIGEIRETDKKEEFMPGAFSTTIVKSTGDTGKSLPADEESYASEVAATGESLCTDAKESLSAGAGQPLSATDAAAGEPLSLSTSAKESRSAGGGEPLSATDAAAGEPLSATAAAGEPLSAAAVAGEPLSASDAAGESLSPTAGASLSDSAAAGGSLPPDGGASLPTTGESLSADKTKIDTAAAGDSPSPNAGDSPSADAGDSPSADTGKSVSASAVAVEGCSISAAGESLSAPDISVTVNNEPTCIAKPSPSGETSSDKNAPLTCESQDSICKEAPPDSGKMLIDTPDLDATQHYSKSVDSPKMQDSSCKTPLNDSVPPSPRNNDDEDGVTLSPTNEDDEDFDCSLSPSDLIETESCKIPSNVNPSGKIESVSSVGDESSGDVGTVMEMIGDVHYYPAGGLGADSSEMVINRYRPEGNPEQSEDEEDDDADEDDSSVDENEESSSST